MSRAFDSASAAQRRVRGGRWSVFAWECGDMNILVVEDENLQAMELAWLVQDAGYAVLGPERSVADARRALDRVRVDLALLDVVVRGETMFPLVKMLDTLDIPVIFLTANPALLPAEYSWRPLVPKPWQPPELLSLIPQVIGRQHGARS